MQEQAAALRELGITYYNETFIDSLSIFFQWLNITLLFQNVRVFAYFWGTLKSSVALVNLSLAYFMLLVSGLTIGNMSIYAGYSTRYLNFFMAFSYTLIPFTKDLETEQVHYAPLTIDRLLLQNLYDITSVWVLLIMFSGLFLPMFSKEFQNKGIRGDEFEDDSNKAKKLKDEQRTHWLFLFWLFDWLPQRALNRLKQFEDEDAELDEGQNSSRPLLKHRDKK